MVDMAVKLKKMIELWQTVTENVEVQVTKSGMPISPKRRSDTAKLARIMLLVFLRCELQVISKITPLFINRMKTIMTSAGIASDGIPSQLPSLSFCPDRVLLSDAFMFPSVIEPWLQAMRTVKCSKLPFVRPSCIGTGVAVYKRMLSFLKIFFRILATNLRRKKE